MANSGVAGRAMSIMARIRAATAKYDPSYRLKKRGLLNAYDMKRLIPSNEVLMEGVKVTIKDEKESKNQLTDDEKAYATRDIINTTEIVKHIKG